jgi:serine acetyltransferase
MAFLKYVKQDLSNNKQNTKGKFIVLSFRLASFFNCKKNNLVFLIIGFPFRLFHKMFVQWILGADIDEKVIIGHGLTIYHGQGLVINPGSIIGSNVILRHNTTIGNKTMGGGAPRIGDNVEIGTSVVIIGEIIIGENSIIGAGTVVTKDIPANSIVYGNPLKIIKRL